MAKAKATARKVIAKGKFLQLVSDNGWEYAERANASGVVAVIAVTLEQQLVLTEQFRPPVGKSVIDLPAGLAGDVTGAESEDLVEAAKRELTEETGYSAKVWKRVYTAPTSPGLTSEVVTYFQANNARQLESGGGVEGERITVQVIPLKSIRRWLRKRMNDGAYVDPKVYVALAFLN